MSTIWIKILMTAFGVLFGIATIAASWIIFRAFKGIYDHVCREEGEL